MEEGREVPYLTLPYLVLPSLPYLTLPSFPYLPYLSAYMVLRCGVAGGKERSRTPRAASCKLQRSKLQARLTDERDPGPWALGPGPTLQTLTPDPFPSELKRACFVLPAGHDPSGGAASVSEAWVWAACRRRLKRITSSWGKVENWHPMIMEIAAYGNCNGRERVANCRGRGPGLGMCCWRS